MVYFRRSRYFEGLFFQGYLFMPCNVDKVIARNRDFYVTLISFARMLRKKVIVVIVGNFNGP